MNTKPCHQFVVFPTMSSHFLLPLSKVEVIYQLDSAIFKGHILQYVSRTAELLRFITESNYFPEGQNNLNVVDRYMYILA